MKPTKTILKKDNDGALSPLALFALVPLIGVGGAAIVWAYDYFSGEPLFTASTGIDLGEYFWIGVIILVIIIALFIISSIYKK